MEAVGWLNIHELAQYHVLMMMWRVTRLGILKHLSEKMTLVDDNLLETEALRLQNTAHGI